MADTAEAEARIQAILADAAAIRESSSMITANAQWLLDELMDNGLEPIEPPEPPSEGDGRNWALDAVWGGPIGSSGRNVVTGKVWDGKKIGGLEENTDYVDAIHKNYSFSGGGTSLAWGDTIPKRVRFFNLQVYNITADYWAYINHGHDEEKNRLWLAIDGLRFEDCRLSGAGMEIKGSLYLLKDLVIGDGCEVAQLVRKRHGRQAVLTGGDAKGKECRFRGWCDWCDVPGAVAVGQAGNLEARFVDWCDDHQEGGGNNMQCEEGLYIGPSVKSGKLGYKSNASCDKYPCLDTVCHPDIDGEVKNVGPEDGRQPGSYADYLDLWEEYGLKG